MYQDQINKHTDKRFTWIRELWEVCVWCESDDLSVRLFYKGQILPTKDSIRYKIERISTKESSEKLLLRYTGVPSVLSFTLVYVDPSYFLRFRLGPRFNGMELEGVNQVLFYNFEFYYPRSSWFYRDKVS